MMGVRGFGAGATDWENGQLLAAAGARWPVGRVSARQTLGERHQLWELHQLGRGLTGSSIA